MIKLYLQQSRPLSTIEAGLQELPHHLQRRILKRKQKRKQWSSLQGYLLLKHALQKEFNTSINDLVFLESGKPILKNQAIAFNISHCKELLGVALCEKGRIGLDIEAFRKFDDVTTAFSFFSPKEQAVILKAANPNWKLIEFWSKKEALVKAVGGQMFDMAGYTDVTSESTIWLGETYFFHRTNNDFNGFIWVCSSFRVPNVKVCWL